jgi:Fur family transcriptional regulator, ferric uptake regulator
MPGSMAGRYPTPRAQRRQWADHASDQLKRAGRRGGGARKRVVALLADQRCCLSAQEVFDRLREQGPPVGIASVYRALDLLARSGLVHRLELDGVAYYEPALPGGEHHHHVVCDGCGKVSPFSDEALEAAINRLAKRLRYSVAGHDVILHGACPDCRAAKRAI